MAAPKGNRNASKGKDWTSALRRVLAQYENPEAKISKGEALSKIAEQCVVQAIAGDAVARAEIANRLDGKPTEYHETLMRHVASEMSEEELERIATGSGAGASDTSEGPQDASSVH
jgi:ribosomal protein L17